jgi:hypothetical protein
MKAMANAPGRRSLGGRAPEHPVGGERRGASDHCGGESSTGPRSAVSRRGLGFGLLNRAAMLEGTQTGAWRVVRQILARPPRCWAENR